MHTEAAATPGAGELYKIPLLVGVVGHRDLVPEEIPNIRAAVSDLLSALKAERSDVRIHLLSAMAEGADLLVAEVATELGIAVIALLPFPLEQCRADLTESARATFDRIMQRAERLELPAPRGVAAHELSQDGASRDLQFQRAGTIIARYSTLLIAIWDGQDTDHAAGTARVVEARRRGLAPNGDSGFTPTDVFLSAGDNDLLYEIRCSRRSTHSLNQAVGISVLGFESNGEKLGGIDKGLPSGLSTLIGRTAEFNRDVDEYGDEISQHGRKLAPPSPYPEPQSLILIDRLFVASDWLGGHFRRCFTRALRARYVLWAALAFLLVSFKKEHEGLFGAASITGVLVIFGLGWILTIWAHRRSWHRRFLDYRALAEGLRVDFYWELAGVRTQFGDEFAHESFLQKQDIELEWIRAAMRAVSLRCALCPQLEAPNGFAQTFAAWVGDPNPASGSGQLQYYRARSKSFEHRQEAMERIGQGMLFVGLALGVVLAIDAVLRLADRSIFGHTVPGFLLYTLALIAVYSAIFESYLSEKADRALIRQYRYMDSLFTYAARELRSARSQPEKLEILRSLGHACLAEHAQWILAHRDKRIEGMRW